MNEEDWPVTAVYEYLGEQPSSYTDQEVAGTYEFISHGRKTDGEMLQTQVITLSEDGKITGAVEGTWEKKDSGKGYDYVTLSIDGTDYKGIFFRQHKENQDPEPVMTFTAVGGNNTCVWGSMAGEENGDMFTSMAAESLKKVILETAKAHGTLPEEFMDCSIAWESADESVITAAGEILVPSEKTKVDLTAVITFGDSVLEETYHVTVKP
jgi:arabinan endo-1,5-alpha-L-arabinosidase